MKSPWGIVAALAALNVAVVLSNAALRSGVASLGKEVRGAFGALWEERARLRSEVVRLGNRAAVLRETAGRLEAALERVGAASQAPGAEASEAPAEGSALEGLFREAGILKKPDPLSIPLLSAEEGRALDEELSRTAGLDYGLLFQGDVEALLRDPGWNPRGVELGPEERGRLAELLSDYRYYHKYAHLERVERFVEPEVARLRAAGSYVEYGQDEPPPEVDGSRITHAEMVPEKPGYLRMYYFFPDEHPEHYRFYDVVQEQWAATVVGIWRLLGGGGR